MALDPKLRDVLDFLPCEPCLQRPSPDQEALCSICHRLNRTVALKCQVSAVSAPSDEGPTPGEVAEAKRLASEKEAEFAALATKREADEEALRAMETEREALLSRQRDLEDRLARLEASSHGGPLTFVDEGPSEDEEPVDSVVEFTRVDLPGHRSEEEIMEFIPTQGAHGASPEGAWQEPATGYAPQEDAWDDEDAWDEPDDVSWDNEDARNWDDAGEAWNAPQEPAQAGTPTPEPAHEAMQGWDEPEAAERTRDTTPEPARGTQTEEGAWDRPDDAVAAGTTEPAQTWEDTHDNPDPWAEAEEAPPTKSDAAAGSWEQAHDDPSPWATDESSAPPARPQASHVDEPEPIPDDLDEKTRADLAELEAQLADLEKELSKRKSN